MDANTGRIYDQEELKKLTDNQIGEMDLVPLTNQEHGELKNMNRKQRRAHLAKMRK